MRWWHVDVPVADSVTVAAGESWGQKDRRARQANLPRWIELAKSVVRCCG